MGRRRCQREGLVTPWGEKKGLPIRCRTWSVGKKKKSSVPMNPSSKGKKDAPRNDLRRRRVQHGGRRRVNNAALLEAQKVARHELVVVDADNISETRVEGRVAEDLEEELLRGGGAREGDGEVDHGDVIDGNADGDSWSRKREGDWLGRGKGEEGMGGAHL